MMVSFVMRSRLIIGVFGDCVVCVCLEVVSCNSEHKPIPQLLMGQIQSVWPYVEGALPKRVLIKPHVMNHCLDTQ